MLLNVLKKLLLLVAGLTIGLGASEVALRVADYKPQLSSAWILGNQDRVLDRGLITVSRRFLEEDFYAAYHDQESDVMVVALGDSFTDGTPVRRCRGRRPPCLNDDSYPGILERLLTDAGIKATVVRAGVGDTGPDQQLRLFKEYILPRLSPQIVVWQFYTNDTWNNVSLGTYTISSGNALPPLDARSNWYYRRLLVYNWIPLPSSVKKSSYVVNLLMRQYEREKLSQDPSQHLNDPLAWRRAKIALEIEEMQRLAKLNNFRVYFVLIAPQAYYLSSKNPLWQWQDNWSSREGEYQNLGVLLDGQPTFIRAEFSVSDVEDATGVPVQDVADVIFATGTRDSLPEGIRHLNEVGYELLARKIAERILTP